MCRNIKTYLFFRPKVNYYPKRGQKAINPEINKFKKFLCLIAFLMVFAAGCEKVIDKPEQIHKELNKIVEMTDKAVQTKDMKLSREVWSKVSEYGLKANELGAEELSASLGKLASTYVYLIEYLQTGDESKLALFRDCFDQAINNLEEILPQNTNV